MATAQRLFGPNDAGKTNVLEAGVVREPIEQPYGIRDCSFRDPAGSLIRIQELR